ncbi:polysaccharide deacetylase family protein [Anaerovorax odorimutans]|uniref:polysaccharide deacetylase family protein n=1 Tax=Anaerovorax odorimutans TaxID=109327 RepID=UPI000425AA89|nr:polysaccharide deacetylase family protein [Anaerovorax odorimutans]
MQKHRFIKFNRFYFKLNNPKFTRLVSIIVFAFIIAITLFSINAFPVNLAALQPKSSDSIKWVDFDVPYELLEKTMYLDIESYNSEVHLNWIELLSYLASKYGGNFKLYNSHDLDQLIEKLNNGDSMKDLTKDMKHYDYYNEAYSAVLSGFLGEFKIEVPVSKESNESNDNTTNGAVKWQTKYGLKVFSPIADGYWYNHYDDFGAGRNYGFDRKHFGHDLMVSTGTPIIAVESGIVEALGWNQYGGWRIGIRSFDKKRYYYYAHLRKDRPYSAGLYEGKAIKAGDVIGYSGRTGYSIKENVNNIDTPHLHYGIQLIFDEKEKDSPNQIWIDLYSITNLLSKNKSQVYKVEETKEYYRKYDFSEPNFYEKENNKNNKLTTPKAVTTLSESKAPEGSVTVPIIMYHGLIKDTTLQNKFFIDPQIFENDLKYLKENKYTPILMKDLIAYVDKGTRLPEKPIVLTFDDGYYNNYLYAYPLLQEYNMKAVISIIGSCTDKYSELNENNASYSHITWDQIKEMQKSKLVEIQNHTYDMHSYDNGRQGSKKKLGESTDDYEKNLNDDIGKLQKEISEKTGIKPTTYTYPFGFISYDAEEILKEMGFRATLSCAEGLNYVTKDPESLYRMKRFIRLPEITSEDFFNKIEK